MIIEKHASDVLIKQHAKFKLIGGIERPGHMLHNSVGHFKRCESWLAPYGRISPMMNIGLAVISSTPYFQTPHRAISQQAQNSFFIGKAGRRRFAQKLGKDVVFKLHQSFEPLSFGIIEIFASCSCISRRYRCVGFGLHVHIGTAHRSLPFIDHTHYLICGCDKQ